MKLSSLPYRYMVLARIRQKEYYDSNGVFNSRTNYRNPLETVDSFTWNQTLEGHRFWLWVHDNFAGQPLPPIPEKSLKETDFYAHLKMKIYL